MVDVRRTIYYFKNHANYYFNDVKKMQDVVEFAELNKGIFDRFINEVYNNSLKSVLFKDMEDGEGYYSTDTSFGDYFNNEMTEIHDVVSKVYKKILNECDDMKSQVKEMKDFINKYHLESFVWRIGSINKRTANRDLNSMREDYLPYKDEILKGCVNILGFREDNEIKDGLEIFELDNQTIKENI